MSNITYPGLNTLDLNLLSPVVNTQVPLTALSFLQVPKTNLNVKSKNGNQIAALSTSLLTDLLSNGIVSLFGDSEFGRGFGTLFSSGVSSAGNTITNNLLKGQLLTEGLGTNTATSLAGTASGLAANFIGKGINSLGGDSMLSRGIGQGVATGLGTIGGRVTSNLIQNGSVGQIFGKGAGAINPYGLAMTVVGSGLGAAFGPSKEYGGEYGGITKTLDTVYDAATAAANFIPGAGLVISGAMALNKGLSNIFGSTDGMTKQDAILGSAFMPAPVKWLNMAGAKTTGTFNNLSWQNTEKTNSFMGNAFGNLGDKFDQARREAGKTYGTFSRGSYRRALRNLDFANNAWDSVLAMADLNELLNIRSLYMTSINNQRYAQMIQGGWNPIYRGKLGMKILNNATNHNMGMRLLSAAALIDDKQMILSAQGGTKVIRPKVKSHGRTNLTKPSYMTEEEWNEYLENRKQFEEYKKSIGVETNNENLYTEEELKQQAEWNAHLLEIRKLQAEEQARKLKLREKAAAKFNLQANLIQTAMNLQANETSFTGLEYQQAAEDLRQKKVEKFHEAEKIGEATLMADLAVSAAPLLLRGFRWAFNKAGLLVRVPLEKTVLETSSVVVPKKYVEFPKDITSDVGELIAEGSERSVYASKSNPNIVYKIEDGNAALEDINNIKIRSELTDDVIAPESTIGYFKHKNGKYYRVTQLDKYKSFNPDNYDSDLSPELNLEIINTLEKAGWKVEVTNGAARTASKNGKVLRNLEHYNWGRDSLGNLKLIDQDVANDFKLQASLESDFKGKPAILSVPKTMRKADSDVVKMNEYHAANVLEYNQSTGNNVTSIPFRTDYNGRLVKVLPNEEFNIVVRNKNTNAPSGNELNIGGMYSKNDDTVYLRNTGNPSNNYHEFLHSSHYGETNPEVTLWRLLQLIDEDKVSKMTPQQKTYYISINETPVHLRLLGERMNINVGDPYPGDVLFDKMLNEHGIGGATYYMKRDTSKAKQLLWKAFNGTLFSGLAATTLYNTNK